MKEEQRNQEIKDTKQRLKEHDAKIDRQYKKAKIKQAAEEKTDRREETTGKGQKRRMSKTTSRSERK